ncbi:glycoside hydrolase family 76 [Corynebacterium choanae]|uniref:Glycosyl hydrolase family 76 n=1 Tax=Corynebacterium choanae TaxID=1862358 RepID=A0A3G6J6U7_9CORY|nr:glycoside hydrolase family 76 [Corynebacterium choanae]AZA12648.1 Glycosyl hydrolase family 76 [Corynebacterium choanae]
MFVQWAHRADLAESAITERHASRVWGIPGTNLLKVAWPPRTRDNIFFHWHYWWQAHYLDCLVDAASRRATSRRGAMIAKTIRGMRIRNLFPLVRNDYYDDKAWMALAHGRVNSCSGVPNSQYYRELVRNVRLGLDPFVGALPWRREGYFFNVPTNGPAAILAARQGEINTTRNLVDWIYEHLIDDRGLVMDGMRCTMNDYELVRDIHPYCQGVVIGALVEQIVQYRQLLGLDDTTPLSSIVNDEWIPPGSGENDQVSGKAPVEAGEKDRRESASAATPRTSDSPVSTPPTSSPAHELSAESVARTIDALATATFRVETLIHAVAAHLADDKSVINWRTGGGDGGLFKGILVRYLADAAVRLPDDTPNMRKVKSIATRLVLRSAESVWNNRLEIDGLPLFASYWPEGAQLPTEHSFIGTRVNGATNGSEIPERDLSTQLSGWMLMEAAARVTRDDV